MAMDTGDELLDAMWSIADHIPPQVLLDAINNSPSVALELGGRLFTTETRECIHYISLVHSSYQAGGVVTPAMLPDKIMSLLDSVLAHIKSSLGGTPPKVESP